MTVTNDVLLLGVLLALADGDIDTARDLADLRRWVRRSAGICG